MIPLWRMVVYNFFMSAGCGMMIVSGSHDAPLSYGHFVFMGFMAAFIGWSNGVIVGHMVEMARTRKISNENWGKIEAHVKFLNGQIEQLQNRIRELESQRYAEGEEWKRGGS